MSGPHIIRISHRDLLFENDDYLAVCKRRGWPVHRTLDPHRSNLSDALESFLRNRDGQQDSYLALHHRLDVATSGVVLFARSKRANPVLSAIFKQRLATKIYVAVCVGAPEQTTGELVDFLARERVGKLDTMVRVARGGKKAITRYRVLQSHRGLSKIEFELVTGRMHQIRAQAALAGFPILGDPQYGDRQVNRERGLSGQLLHARLLSFQDPLTRSTITICAPVPRDIEGALSDAAGQGPGPGAEAGHRYLLFYKPYGVLSQFTSLRAGERCLAEFGLPESVYPVGRLDKDSEGLLLLTSDGAAKNRLSHPRYEKQKRYWVQVDGVPDDEAISSLAAGVTIKGYRTKACKVRRIEPPAGLPPRDPPIRVRKKIPTSWIEVILTEGKNRQVRRMTAVVGHPTLRLVRAQVAGHSLTGLSPGEFRELASF